MNLFTGWTEAELLASLREAQEELSAGSQLEAAGSGDVSSTRRIQVGPVSRIRMLSTALNKLDPDTYPASDYTVPTRAVAVMGNVSDLSQVDPFNRVGLPDPKRP